MGYDISNYQDIDPQYGTLDDMDELIRGIHARDMKLLLDLVINHTSDQHAWFQESRRNKTNSKADWYMWQPPKYSTDGERLPPNNWASLFGGSAWTYVPERDEYYLHLFLESQPDLNWERGVLIISSRPLSACSSLTTNLGNPRGNLRNIDPLLAPPRRRWFPRRHSQSIQQSHHLSRRTNKSTR